MYVVVLRFGVAKNRENRARAQKKKKTKNNAVFIGVHMGSYKSAKRTNGTELRDYDLLILFFAILNEHGFAQAKSYVHNSNVMHIRIIELYEYRYSMIPNLFYPFFRDKLFVPFIINRARISMQSAFRLIICNAL
jgi:hypothetical protein